MPSREPCIRCILSGRPLRPETDDYLLVPFGMSNITASGVSHPFPPLRGKIVSPGVFEVAKVDREMAVWFLPHLPFNAWEITTHNTWFEVGYLGSAEYEALGVVEHDWTGVLLSDLVEARLNALQEDFISDITHDQNRFLGMVSKSWGSVGGHETAVSTMSHGIMSKHNTHGIVAARYAEAIMYRSRVVCRIAPELNEGIKRLMYMELAPLELRKIAVPALFLDTVSLEEHVGDVIDPLPAVLQFNKGITEAVMEQIERDSEEYD